mgnify:CR=1 FL=1
MNKNDLFDKHQCYFCNIRKDPSKKGFRSVVELHHIVEKNQGGSNVQSNLVPVCSTHHSLIHEGYIEIKGWFFSTKGWILIWKDHEGKEHWGRPNEPYYP